MHARFVLLISKGNDLKRGVINNEWMSICGVMFALKKGFIPKNDVGNSMLVG